MSPNDDVSHSCGEPGGEVFPERTLGPEHQLDAWTSAAWTGGLQIDDVPPLEPLTVCTLNSTYTIVVLRSRTGDVLVRGGRLFPIFRRAVLAGASAGGSLLKMGGIYPGLMMEIVVGRRRVLTSPVVSINRFSPTLGFDPATVLDPTPRTADGDQR